MHLIDPLTDKCVDACRVVHALPDALVHSTPGILPGSPRTRFHLSRYKQVITSGNSTEASPRSSM